LVGTIFENSKLPLRVWFGAIWLLTNHPKGIASTTLARDLGITQKSAWFVLHRLRHAARTRSFNKPPLTGTVEVDETYVGGKVANRHKHERRKRKGRAGPVEKTPVMVPSSAAVRLSRPSCRTLEPVLLSVSFSRLSRRRQI
jgi:hypothetical protein